MKIKKTVEELIKLFDYKRPIVNIEKVKKGKKTPEGAILDLLFFWDKNHQPVLAKFFISEAGVAVTVSPTYNKTIDIYSGSGTPKEIGIEVINYLGHHFKNIQPWTHQR